MRLTVAGSAGFGPNGQAVRCRVLKDGVLRAVSGDLPDLRAALADPGAFLWCDAVTPRAADLAPIAEALGLHPLAVEDALVAHQRPKIEPYGEGAAAYWFIVVHPAHLTEDELGLHEVAIFAGRAFLVTVRAAPPWPLDEVEARLAAHLQTSKADGGFCLYTLLDTIVDDYFPVADWFEERVDAIEASLFQDRTGQAGLLERIFSMKKDSQRFRRAAWPVRDILGPVVRGDLPLFDPAHAAYFRDVYDHAVRVVDQVDATRDLANSALDVQLAVTANRQNEVSKQLTVIATVFLPLSFITGFFGQNFGVLLKFVQAPWSFWVFGVASELVAVALLIAFFRWRHWF